MIHTEPRLLYPRKDAAYQLGVSVRGLDRLIANKHIQTRRIGGRVLIPHGELKRFARADHFNVAGLEAQPHRKGVAEPDEHIGLSS